MTTIVTSGQNQTLTGTTGNDTFQFLNPWGQDSVSDSGGNNNTLDFSGVTERMILSINNPNSGVSNNSTSYALTFVGGLENNIKDVALFDYTQFSTFVGSGKGNDFVINTSNKQVWCKGGTGNNSILNEGGNNTLIAGSGNDDFENFPGVGNTLYTFYSGFGNDFIANPTNTSTGWQQLNFLDNASHLILAPSATTNDWYIEDDANPNPDHQITIKQGEWINRIHTGDGLQLTGTDINTLFQEMTAYAAAHSEPLNSIQDVKNDPNLLQMVHSAWHS